MAKKNTDSTRWLTQSNWKSVFRHSLNSSALCEQFVPLNEKLLTVDKWKVDSNSKLPIYFFFKFLLISFVELLSDSIRRPVIWYLHIDKTTVFLDSLCIKKPLINCPFEMQLDLIVHFMWMKKQKRQNSKIKEKND